MRFRITDVNNNFQYAERESLESILEEINNSKPFFIFEPTQNNHDNKKYAWHKDFIVSVHEEPEVNDRATALRFPR